MNTTTISGLAAAAASWATSKVGCPYSQPRRLEDGVFDCSSLVARAYTAQGKKWRYGGSVPISCDEVYDDDFELLWPASYADIGRKMGGKDAIARANQPGDIQFICTDTSTKRTNRITHVAMVADAHRIVHARGVKYGVVTSPVYQYAGKVCAVIRYNPACLLRTGMKGWRTLALQQKLRASGHSLVADGEYGAETAAAVKAFQMTHDLNATGKADADTLTMLAQSNTQSALHLVNSSTLKQISITGDSVNLRMGPGTNYPVKGGMHCGDTLQAIDTKAWIPVMKNGDILWVSARYVHLAEST